MERIRVTKVDDVTLWRRGQKFEGSLHLTQHHLIFSFIPPPNPEKPTEPPPKKAKELWVAYPMIAYCTYRPAPPVSRHQSSIRLRCRDFTFVALQFESEVKARDVYETIRNLTCRLGSLEKLYAFSYQAQGPEKSVNGWAVYNPMEEFRRLGVGSQGAHRGWRITHINAEYQYSPTYPKILAVPASISDNVLNYGGKHRSRVRIPALTYLHPVNDCSITRCSQPMVGVRGNRSVQDEKLVAAIFATSKSAAAASAPGESPEGHEGPESSNGSQNTSQSTSDGSDGTLSRMATEQHDAEALEAEVSSKTEIQVEQGPKIYGSQQHNLIVDARPPVNALAMQAVGMGSESMDNYPSATKAYLGIENIHVMRDSLAKVIDALKESDFASLPPNRELLLKSGWLKHIANMLDGVNLIARQVGIHHSHVLIHCSDGWDRTSQLSALSQLCLDPYYRTIEGFIVLVEKDFVSFGHMFRHRSGPLSSEKWFEIENERVSGNRTGPGDSPFGARGDAAKNAIEDGLARVKGFFNNKKTDSRESLRPAATENDEMQPFDAPPSTRAARDATAVATATEPTDNTPVTKPKETAPIFHQFLDATWQLLHQHPTRFEFNERFLRRLFYHLFACQYGTFLYDNEKQRVDANAPERTCSVWDYFLARREQFLNDKYDPVIDDKVRGRERLLFPDTRKVRWWAELFGRTDDEMNGPGFPSTANLTTNGSSVSTLGMNDAYGGPSEVASVSESAVLGEPKGPDGAVSQGAQHVAAGMAQLGIGAEAEAARDAYAGQSHAGRGVELEMQ